jgi:hypothetical protein
VPPLRPKRRMRWNEPATTPGGTTRSATAASARARRRWSGTRTSVRCVGRPGARRRPRARSRRRYLRGTPAHAARRALRRRARGRSAGSSARQGYNRRLRRDPFGEGPPALSRLHARRRPLALLHLLHADPGGAIARRESDERALRSACLKLGRSQAERGRERRPAVARSKPRCRDRPPRRRRRSPRGRRGDDQRRLSSCTAATSAATWSGLMSGDMPWPRLKTWPSREPPLPSR